MSVTPEDAARLAVSGNLDYAALGFRCGLEIHQQLDTRKLYSPCPSGVVDPDEVSQRTVGHVDRRLRATQSELGETDAAAISEAKRQKAFRYLIIKGLTSLVELDEEPPHPMADDALDVTLTFASLLGARPVAEVHTMRKTVIDGSNTSGFQRTALVATGGTVDVHATTDHPDVGVWTIAVEEDSARKVDDQDGLVTYTLDRLGVPLIEVATAPDILDPEHAQATAARIGALLRATGRVRRGLGSIRQDLNVSIEVGDRVEIKGCQDLRAIPRVIECEVRRQLWLYHIRAALQERGFQAADVGHPQDVSDAFQKSKAKVVQAALKRNGSILGLALPKWAGLIQGAAPDGPRMGREFADHAKVAAGVKGVFHSDELPAYGITKTEVDAVRGALGLEDEDAFVLCAAPGDVARRALEAVADRAVAALGPCPREVRAAQPDDTTRYMRPLPGAARMYPETDVPPIRITKERLARIHDDLPPRPEERIADLVAHGLSKDLAGQLVRDGNDATFDRLVAADVEPALAARVLTQYLDGCIHPDDVLERIPALAEALRAGRFAKEAVPDLIAVLDKDPTQDLDAAIAAAGAEAISTDDVDAVVQRIVADRLDFVQERGMAAMGPLMGPVMAELRGKADGALVSARLKAVLQETLKD